MIPPRAIVLLAALVAGLLLAGLSRCKAHEIFTHWRNPETGMSCCNDADCYPTEAKFEHGQWLAQRREDQRWLAIPDRVVLKDGATPDGKAYLCAPPPLAPEDLRIYCFRPPLMGI